MLAKLLRSVPMSGVGANETTGLSIYDWRRLFAPGAAVNYGGNSYRAFKVNGGGPGGAYYSSNSVVFALAAKRILLFSEARFQWQQLRGGSTRARAHDAEHEERATGELFGTPDLKLLEEPWPGHTTADLLAQADLDVLQAGNSYWVIDDTGYLLRLDATKMGIVTEAATEAQIQGTYIGERLLYYVYKPSNDPSTWTKYEPQDVAHYKPYPDPNNRFIGMSWLTPCLPDIETDCIVTEHKKSVIENGAALSTIVSFPPETSKPDVEWYIEKFRVEHEGPSNAGKTLFIGNGADAKVIGQTFENLALQAVQNAGETRVAACSGVPSVMVGFSESLKGSSLNAGNYGEARRNLADTTMRPFWRIFAGAFQSLLNVPAGARLWYDVADVPFLQEDQSDAADIGQKKSVTLEQLIRAGFKPDACVQAVITGDFSRLSGQHTGLTSVQLVPPGNGEPFDSITPAGDKPAPFVPAPANGNGAQPVAP